jgi:hypothetical protein
LRISGRNVAAALAFGAGLLPILGANRGQAAEPTVSQSTEPISYSETTVGNVPLKLITVDLASESKVTGMMAKGGSGRSESWSSMIGRARPTVAVTGTFFCTETLIPIGDLVIAGQLAHFGGMGSALCISDANQALLRMPPRYRHIDWSPFDFVMRSGPTLVRHSEVRVRPRAEGFQDPGLLRATGRLAVGISGPDKLIIAATRNPVTLNKMAWVMLKLGARDAINLDAGGSMGLYYKGKTLIKPGRKLTNLLLVYGDRARYDQVRNELAPARQTASSR